ncbi:MAG: MFS transporter, partial [Aeoliella sp.]
DALTTLVAAGVLLGYFRMRRLSGEANGNGARSLRASPLRDREFVAVLVLLLASTIVFFQFLSTYPLYLRDHYGLDEIRIGLLFAVNTVVIVLFEMLLIDYVKRWPLLRTIGWGSFLSCAGFGLLAFGSTMGYAIFAMLVLTIGEMLSMPLTTGYVANRAPVGSEARYMGWLAMTISLAFVLGPAIGASVYAVDRDAVWIACLLIGFAVLVGFYLLPTAKCAEAPDIANEAEPDGIESPREEVAEAPV